MQKLWFITCVLFLLLPSCVFEPSDPQVGNYCDYWNWSSDTCSSDGFSLVYCEFATATVERVTCTELYGGRDAYCDLGACYASATTLAGDLCPYIEYTDCDGNYLLYCDVTGFVEEYDCTHGCAWYEDHGEYFASCVLQDFSHGSTCDPSEDQDLNYCFGYTITYCASDGYVYTESCDSVCQREPPFMNYGECGVVDDWGTIGCLCYNK